MKQCPECGSTEVGMFYSAHMLLSRTYLLNGECEACGLDWTEIEQTELKPGQTEDDLPFPVAGEPIPYSSRVNRGTDDN